MREGGWGHNCTSHVVPWMRFAAFIVCSDVILPLGCQCGSLRTRCLQCNSLNQTIVDSNVVQQRCSCLNDYSCDQCWNPLVCHWVLGRGNTMHCFESKVVVGTTHATVLMMKQWQVCLGPTMHQVVMYCVRRSWQHCWESKPKPKLFIQLWWVGGWV